VRDAEERQKYLASRVPTLNIDGLDQCELAAIQYVTVLALSLLTPTATRVTRLSASMCVCVCVRA